MVKTYNSSTTSLVNVLNVSSIQSQTLDTYQTCFKCFSNCYKYCKKYKQHKISTFKTLISNTQYSNTKLIYVQNINMTNDQERYYCTIYCENSGTVICSHDTSPGKWFSLSTVHIAPEATRWRSMSRSCYVTQQLT